MPPLRARIDSGFASFGRTIFRNPIKTLVLVALVAAALLSQLPKLRSDNSNEVFFRKDDPAMIQYDAFREQFGRDELFLVGVDPPTVFDLGFLRKLRELHEALENEVPYLKEVTSLVNVRDTRGEGDELVVEDLLKVLPETPEAMAKFKERVLGSRLYPNLYISEDGGFTVILMETLAYSPKGEEGDLLAGFGEPSQGPQGQEQTKPIPLTEAEDSEIVRAIERVAARFDGPDFSLHITGAPVINDFFNTSIARDVGKFMSLAFVAFTVFLIVLFRRISGAVLALAVVVLSLGCTISLMAIFDAPFSSISSIIPTFMMSVGVGSSVHILAVFYRQYYQTENKEEALVYAFGHSGLPVFMTSVTTAVGLLSFSIARLAPVADLGIYGGAGVMIVLSFTLVMIPAMVGLLPLRPRARFMFRGAHGRAMDRILTGIADFATSRAPLVVILSAVVVLASGAGLFWQGFGHNYIKWLPPELEVRKSVELFDRELKGFSTVEVVIDVGAENGLYEPAVLNKIEALGRFAEGYRDEAGKRVVGKITSILNVLKETHQALNENRPEFYAIPQDRELIAQELLLFENSGSDDLERLVDSRFSRARMSARVVNKDAAEYVDFVNQLGAEAERLFAGTAKVTVTGTLQIFTQIIQQLLVTLAKSYTLAGVVITVLMILMLGSFRIGLLSMIPNLAPIVITMGLMGWMGIQLDLSNMLLGTVAIGLAVDDTIHFFHNFRTYYTQTQNAAEATRQTMLTTGRAMLFTTLVLVTGFWLFMFATLINLIQFGFLIGVTLIIALLGDIFLAPALMELITRTQRGREILLRWGKAQTA